MLLNTSSVLKLACMVHLAKILTLHLSTFLEILYPGLCIWSFLRYSSSHVSLNNVKLCSFVHTSYANGFIANWTHRKNVLMLCMVFLLIHYKGWWRWNYTFLICYSGAKIHNSDVIMSPMASQITSLTIVYSTVSQIKENIKAPRPWPLWGKFIGDHWNPRPKDQWRGKNVSIWWRHHDIVCVINGSQ